MTLSISGSFLCFWIYSAIGWLGETVYAFHVHHRFVNRGFLNGPYCPLYGLGGIGFALVSELLHSKNVLLVFVWAFVFATVLEFLTGYLLELFFKRRYWDYSDARFNIKGYVCLGASLIWGAAGVIAVWFIHPVVERIVDLIPKQFQITVAIGLAVIFSVDVLLTVLQNIQFSDRLRALTELAEQMRLRAFDSDASAELRRRYDRLVEELHSAHKRILDAFPKMDSITSKKAMQSVREFQLEYRRRLKVFREKRKMG